MQKFTLIRSVPYEEIERVRPDAFMFVRRGDNPFSLEEIWRILNSDEVLRHMPVPREKILASTHVKRDLGEKHGEVEARLYITANTHYVLPIDDNHADWKLLFHRPTARSQFRVQEHFEGMPSLDGYHYVNYQEMLNTCGEVYRTNLCDMCPKRGKQCVMSNLEFEDEAVFKDAEDATEVDTLKAALDKLDAWPFIMPCTRPDASAMFLRQGENGSLEERDAWIEQFSFVSPPEEKNDPKNSIGDRIIQGLTGTVVAGFEFFDPAKTLPTYVENRHLHHRYRPPRYVVFEGTRDFAY